MSDKETPDTGEEAADETVDAPPETTPAASNDKPKRKVKRKSVWVCVPTEWEEVAVQEDDGTMRAERQPTGYSITECPGGPGQKKEIVRVLARHQIDPLNFDGVLMFRSSPINFDIEQQLIIRIQGV